MAYDVRTVRDRNEMNDFLGLPFRIYRGNRHWVPPLSSEVRRVLDPLRNPYFRNATLDLFVCYREGVPAARTILVVNDEHCRTFNVRTGFFGFYESLNDHRATVALFESVASVCRSRTIDTLEGPFNPNHYSELGLLADWYDRDQGFFQTYNPPYYHELLGDAGFSVEETFFTARNDDVQGFLAGESPAAGIIRVTGDYAVRHFAMNEKERDLEEIREVFNDSFAANWHFLPASRGEHVFAAKYLRMVTNPSLITIVEHRGNPVGVLMCALDVNPLLRRFHGHSGPVKLLRFMWGRSRIRTLVVYAVGIKKGYQRTRVFALLLNDMRHMAAPFDVLECTWMSPGNTLAIAAAERMGMKEYKHFAMYRKVLATPARPAEPVTAGRQRDDLAPASESSPEH